MCLSGAVAPTWVATGFRFWGDECEIGAKFSGGVLLL